MQALDFDTCDLWADVCLLYSESVLILIFARCHLCLPVDKAFELKAKLWEVIRYMFVSRTFHPAPCWEAFHQLEARV